MRYKREAPAINLGLRGVAKERSCRPKADLACPDHLGRHFQNQGHQVAVLEEVLAVLECFGAEAVYFVQRLQHIEEGNCVRSPKLRCDTDKGTDLAGRLHLTRDAGDEELAALPRDLIAPGHPDFERLYVSVLNSVGMLRKAEAEFESQIVL